MDQSSTRVYAAGIIVTCVISGMILLKIVYLIVEHTEVPLFQTNYKTFTSCCVLFSKAVSKRWGRQSTRIFLKSLDHENVF